MKEELKQAVVKALQKNHRNGPIHARNLAAVYEQIIIDNQNETAEKIASLINDEEMKLDEEDNGEEENED